MCSSTASLPKRPPLDTTYHNYLTAHGLAETDPGVAVGAQAGCRYYRPASQ